MIIESIEIQNFRKLKSTRVDFDEKTTLFVGANNSGKTSAMVALRYFLVAPQKLSIRDITIGNWPIIDAIGRSWENSEDSPNNLIDFLPKLDIWLNVPLSEIHRVIQILPTLDWCGGMLGVRLQYEPDTIETLQREYLAERKNASEALSKAKSSGDSSTVPKLWPQSLMDYLDRRLTRHLNLRAYSLDPEKLAAPVKGVAHPQTFLETPVPLDDKPFRKLIRVDEIAAQRDFADAGDSGSDVGTDVTQSNKASRFKRRLSHQLRTYYDRHLDPTKMPTADDIEALGAIQFAEKKFDDRLRVGFEKPFEELEDLGYPGVTNPKIEIITQLRATDGMKHKSALQYKIADSEDANATRLLLPEDYSGLGYQNLISMVFMLMSYRDDWMRVGKAKEETALEDNQFEDSIPILHVVLVEEPEAYLHAQVQQVFIKKAYKLLRNHDKLGNKRDFCTQLVISTHSSHIAHEVDFSSLRYFRRRQTKISTDIPTTTVANLSFVFGIGDTTQRFVKRYLKATHCDLFFADAAIFVEGQAERILIPHFIRHHYTSLSRRYVTLLELGGSHAHRFKDLVHELGLTTLIISDIDAGVVTPTKTRNGKNTTRIRAIQPAKGKGHVTTNPVLRKWHPKLSKVDDLLNLLPSEHAINVDGDYDLYIAFQGEQTVVDIDQSLVIPRTFEDALIFENPDSLNLIEKSALSQKISNFISEGSSGEELANKVFGLIKGADKSAFALGCLMVDDPKTIKAPPYIHSGLTWLQSLLDDKDLSNTVGAAGS